MSLQLPETNVEIFRLTLSAEKPRRKNQPQAITKAAPRQIYRTQLQKLEKQWQEYNRRRTELNMQIQQAAKVVAAESQVLRSRLITAGFTEDEIDTQLKQLDASDLAESSVLLEPSRMDPAGPLEAETEAARHITSLPHQELDQILKPPLSSSIDLLPTWKSATGNENAGLSGQPSQENDNGKQSGISCARAAEILLDMSANSNRDEVEAELGCASEADCEIDNLRLFEIMNR